MAWPLSPIDIHSLHVCQQWQLLHISYILWHCNTGYLAILSDESITDLRNGFRLQARPPFYALCPKIRGKSLNLGEDAARFGGQFSWPEREILWQHLWLECRPNFCEISSDKQADCSGLIDSFEIRRLTHCNGNCSPLTR